MAKAQKFLLGQKTIPNVVPFQGSLTALGEQAYQASKRQLFNTIRNEKQQNFLKQKEVTDGIVSGLYSDQFSADIQSKVGELAGLNSNSVDYAKKLAEVTGELKVLNAKQANNTAAIKAGEELLKDVQLGGKYYSKNKFNTKNQEIVDQGFDIDDKGISEEHTRFFSNYKNLEGSETIMNNDWLTNIVGNKQMETLEPLQYKNGQVISKSSDITSKQMYTLSENGISVPIYKNADAVPMSAVESFMGTSQAHRTLIDGLANQKHLAWQNDNENATAEEVAKNKEKSAKEALLETMKKSYPGYKKAVSRSIGNLPSQIINPTPRSTGSGKAEDLVQRVSTITNFSSDVINNASLSESSLAELTGLPQAPDIQGYEVSNMFDDLTVDTTIDGEKTKAMAYESLIFDPTSDRANPIFYAKRQGSNKYERLEGAGIFNSLGESMQTSDKYKDSDLKQSILENYGNNALNSDGSINFGVVTKFDKENYDATKDALADQKILNDARQRAINNFYNPVDADGVINVDAKSEREKQKSMDPTKYSSDITNVSRGSVIQIPEIGSVRIQSMEYKPGTSLLGIGLSSAKMKVNYIDTKGEVGSYEINDSEVENLLTNSKQSMLFRDDEGVLTTNDMIRPDNYKGLLSDQEIQDIENEILNN